MHVSITIELSERETAFVRALADNAIKALDAAGTTRHTLRGTR